MQFSANEGAAKVMTVWISVGGIAATAMVSALAGLLVPALLNGVVVIGAVTVAAALWYPSRYVSRLRGSYDGQSVRATTGVFGQKQLFVPMESLRTFEVFSTPVQRLFGCRTLILRFAGGAAIIPLLPADQAEALAAALERHGT